MMEENFFGTLTNMPIIKDKILIFICILLISTIKQNNLIITS